MIGLVPPVNLALDPASDSGILVDGIMDVAEPTIDGDAAAGSAVTLYNTSGTTAIGAGVADANDQLSNQQNPPAAVNIGAIKAAQSSSFASTPLSQNGVLNVGTEQELDSAIVMANAATPGQSYTIKFTNNILEATNPAAIDLPAGVQLTIDGGNDSLDGGSTYRGLFVEAGDVTIQSLTIRDSVAQGGAGGAGSGGGGGGGGAGLGGGLFVGPAATVMLNAVSFDNNSAVGGAGGANNSEQFGNSGGGGGGGLSGAGETGSAGIGNGSGGTAGGGGGLGGTVTTASGANGAFGGGGGGAGYNTALPAGNGGFGGGGGGGDAFGNAGGTAGFGGGSGIAGPGNASTAGAGGGGLGAGGDIFVQQGGNLAIGSGTLENGSVTGGSSVGNPGLAFGSSVFLQGSSTLTLDPAANQTLVIAGSIFDQAGPYNSTSQPNSSVVIGGAGTVELDAINLYEGGTVIDSGTLVIGASGNLAGANGDGGSVTFAANANATLVYTPTTLPPNVISGFAYGDAIVLRELAYAGSNTVTVAGDTVTVFSADYSMSLSLGIVGAASDHFVLGVANGGGTQLTLGGPPTPDVTEGLSDDTGSSASDHITSNAALDGTADANANVILTDGSTVLGATVSDNSGNWSFIPSGLQDGSHTIVASETNTYGNIGTASVTFTLDTSTPVAPAALALTVASDSGTQGDGITNVTSPVITGTGTAGDTVTLYDTNGTALGTAVVAGNGSWSITTSTLTDSSHTITAKQNDMAGMASAASTAFTLSIDTTIPAPPTAPTLSPLSDSGVQGDGITTVTTPIISGTASAGDTVTLFDTDGTTILGTAVADANGAWSLVSSTLAVGTHTLTATQADVAANTSRASTVFLLTINEPAPEAPAGLALSPASDTGVLGDNITSVTTPTILGTGLSGDDITLYDGALKVGAAMVAPDGTWAITTGTLLAGMQTLTATETDYTSNVSIASAPLMLTIDGTVVTSTSFSLAGGSGTLSLGILAPVNPTFAPSQLTISVASLPTNGTVTLADGTPATVGEILSATQLTGLLFTPASLVASTSSFVYTVLDPANVGNTGTVQLATGSNTPVISVYNQIPNTATPSITGEALPGTQVTLISNGVAIGTTTSDPRTGSYSVTASAPLSLGLHRLVVDTTLPGGTTTASAPLSVFDVPQPVAGTSTTDVSSADIGFALQQGAQLAFVSGTEAIQLTDAILSVGVDTVQATIQRLYEGLFGYGNDPAGLSFWNSMLNEGHSKADVAAGFLNSNEFVAKYGAQISDQQFVDILFEGMLGRPADQDASFWTAGLTNGASRADVAVAIADSAEAKAHLAVDTTHVYVPQVPGTLAHELYETGLNREVELAALSQVNSSYSKTTPAALAQAIAGSVEFQNDHAGQSNSAYVQSLFINGLGYSDPNITTNFWTTSLNTGILNRADVFLGIASSAGAAAHLTYDLGH